MENEPQTSLVAYVTKRIDAGASKSQIKEQLTAVGWTEDQVDAAYSKALIQRGVPVPNDDMQETFGKKSSYVEIAVNLFSFVLLGIVASAVGILLYQVINYYFPDPLNAGGYRSRISTSTIHYSIAALIIGFPIYYASIRMWFRGFREDKGKTETILTKLLTYLVLLIASITVVGDLIVVVFTFLQGEIGMRFILKALTIFMISGGIFGFYFLERKKIQYRQPIPQKKFIIFGWIVSAVVLTSIILGFFVGGSPSTERKRGFDAQRESDLSSIANCIEDYAAKHNRLPSTLAELEKSNFSYCTDEVDPETNLPYEYTIVTTSRQMGSTREAEFQLCANFALASDDTLTTKNSYHYNNDTQWNDHGTGRNCDTMTVVLENFTQ